MQSKKQSFIEAFTNTTLGFIVAYLSAFIIYPLVGYENDPGKNFIITVFFTVISITRSYIIRRHFNKKHMKSNE